MSNKFSTIQIKVPDVNRSFTSGNVRYSSPSTKAANINLIKRIYTQYGATIDRWATALDLGGRGVIAAFIATESGGSMTPANGKPTNQFGATGLMQITAVAFYDAFYGWGKEVKIPMPKEVEDEIKKKAAFLSSKQTPSFSSVKNRILALLQTDASFNILAGCLCLRWLCERFSNNRIALFNRVMVAYNAGAYTRSMVVSGTKTQANKTPVDTTTLVNNMSVPSESRNYLVKMMGVDGFLDLIYKQKLV